MSEVKLWSSISDTEYNTIDEFRVLRDNITSVFKVLGENYLHIFGNYSYCTEFEASLNWYMDKHINSIIENREYPIFFVIAQDKGSISDSNIERLELTKQQFKDLRLALSIGLPVFITDAHVNRTPYVYFASNYTAFEDVVKNAEIENDKVIIKAIPEWFARFEFEVLVADEETQQFEEVILDESFEVEIADGNKDSFITEYRYVYSNQLYARRYINKYFDGLVAHGHTYGEELIKIPDDTDEIVSEIKEGRNKIESVSTKLNILEKRNFILMMINKTV